MTRIEVPLAFNNLRNPCDRIEATLVGSVLPRIWKFERLIDTPATLGGGGVSLVESGSLEGGEPGAPVSNPLGFCGSEHTLLLSDVVFPHSMEDPPADEWFVLHNLSDVSLSYLRFPLSVSLGLLRVGTKTPTHKVLYCFFSILVSVCGV